MRNDKKVENIACYLMILPMIIGLLVFTLYPIFWIAKYSVYDYDGVNAIFTGLANYKRIFTNEPGYWKSILNAIIIAYGKLIIEIPLALIIAVLLKKRQVSNDIFRGIFYMPAIIGISVCAVVFTKIFATSGGIINDLFKQMGIIKEPINWFGQKWTAMLVIIIMSIWKNFGINMLFFMAGVQGISSDYYEAAEIDGATRSQQFFKITLPLLMPVARTIVLLAISSGIQLLDPVMLLTNGGPGGSTNVVMLYIYQHFFETNTTAPQIGFSSALGIVTSVIIFILSIAYLKLSDKAEKTI